MVQSIIAIADVHIQENAIHQEAQTSIAHDHQDHGSHNKQTITAQDHSQQSEHGECHQGHCHHSSVVFIVKEHTNNNLNIYLNKAHTLGLAFNSIAISPDLRPPIV